MSVEKIALMSKAEKRAFSISLKEKAVLVVRVMSKEGAVLAQNKVFAEEGEAYTMGFPMACPLGASIVAVRDEVLAWVEPVSDTSYRWWWIWARPNGVPFIRDWFLRYYDEMDLITGRFEITKGEM